MDKVAILLCTYNDKYFLPKQLVSYITQTHQNWELHVSNDGDLPDTLQTLNHFQKKCTQLVKLREGPKQGFALNFLSLSCDENIKANYFAFSDQDDIWENDKLSRAISYLKTISAEIPAIYCSRTTLINSS
ncbi:MAG TPA: glycosyltransferase, partial [Gammaproteobacteria bacterium]|nr:glycosyltransferase [Gammaproteobacteria bacterium]